MALPDTTARLSCGLNLFVDSMGPTSSLVASVLQVVYGPRSVALKLVSQGMRHDYHARPTLFSRACSPELQWLPDMLYRHGARYALYLDDNLWEYDRDSELGRYYARSGVRRALDQFVSNASNVVVNSKYLTHYLQNKFPATPFTCLPAPFDFSLLREWSHDGLAPKPLRVGYAGSERGKAFGPVVTAIEHMLTEHPDEIEFEFIGYMPDRLADKPGVRFFEAIQSYPEFLAFKQSRSWDIGLAPLEDDIYSRSKTNNKFREYGALGITGLYSNVEAYSDCVQHHHNGLLVGHGPEAWAMAMAWALKHRASLPKIGAKARSDVWEKHRLEVVAPQWKQALELSKLTATRNIGFEFEWQLRRQIGRVMGWMDRHALQ